MSITERTPWPRNPRYLVGEDGSIVGPRGWPLTPARTGGGYLFVNVWPRGQRRSEYVHTIVCETFHGPRPEGMQVAHEDGDQDNCAAANLSWKTPVDNAADKRRHGTHTYGEGHGPARLTEEQARAILAAIGTCSQRALAVRFGVSQQCISMIATGTNWRHLR